MDKPLLDLETMEPPKEVAVDPAAPSDKPETTEEKKDDEPESKETDDPEKQEEPSEEKKDDEKSDEKKEDEPKDDDVVDVDAFLSDNYKEKYGIENQESLEETLASLDSLAAENKDLTAKLAAAEKKEPVYKSEKQKKIAEFLNQFDPEKFSEGLRTAATVMSMDVDATDGKLALQEDYILDHPEWSREDAIFKFEKHFNKKYKVKDRESFDGSDAEYDEEKKDKELDRKSDEAKARKRLKKEQEDLRTAEPEKEQPKEVENKEVTKSIERFQGEFEKTFKSFESNDEYHLNIKIDDDKENSFPVKFNKEQLKEIRASVDEWIKTRSSYSKDGEINGKLTVPDMIKKAAFFLYGEEIAFKVAEHALTIGDIKKAEEIAKKKPNREQKVADGGDVKNMDPMKQFEIQAQRKKEKREGKRVAA